MLNRASACEHFNCADFTDEWPTERTGESRNTVELRETPGARSYWEEIKGNGCKYFRNAITHRYLSECGDVWKTRQMCEKNVAFIKWRKIT